MAFYGRASVIATRRKHRRTGKLVQATLYRRTSGDTFGITQTYAYAYEYPNQNETGLSGDGFPDSSGRVVLYQEGETYAPRVDDRVTINGHQWQIVRCSTRLNGQSGYAVHDLDVE